MLSASWERAAKPGTPPTTGDPHPPAGRHLSSSSELGVCWPSKATTFYSVCTEPKQTTVYRLLFSFYSKRGIGVLSLPSGLSTLPSLTLAPADYLKGRLWSHCSTALLWPVKEWEQVQELVSTTATRAGAVWASALRVPAVHVAFFNTATRLDSSVLTTPSSPFCFPLLYFLSVRRPYFFSFPSRGVELSELHLLLSLSTLLSCCQIDLSLFKTVTLGMRLGGFNLNYKKKKKKPKPKLCWVWSTLMPPSRTVFLCLLRVWAEGVALF